MSSTDILLQAALAKYKGNQAIITLITSILRDLETSQVLEFLRLKGRATLTYSMHPIENAALMGARSAGYNECLDDLINFVQFFIEDRVIGDVPTLPVPNFGGYKAALDKGTISKEEYEQLTNATGTSRTK